MQISNDRLHQLSSVGIPQSKAKLFCGNPANVGKLEIKNQDSNPEILIYEQIGLDWWGDGVTAKSFAAQLADIQSDTIKVRINSPGGDVFDGITIFNLLAEHPADIDVSIDGIAASAASVIAMAGDRITAAKNAQMMIHSAWTVAAGNADDFLDVAELLGKIDGQIAETYAVRTGNSLETVRGLMSKDSYLTADEAYDLNLVDEVVDNTPTPEAEPAPEASRHQRIAAARRRRIALRRQLSI